VLRRFIVCKPTIRRERRTFGVLKCALRVGGCGRVEVMGDLRHVLFDFAAVDSFKSSSDEAVEPNTLGCGKLSV
jgi:hypothetical protein